MFSTENVVHTSHNWFVFGISDMWNENYEAPHVNSEIYETITNAMQ